MSVHAWWHRRPVLSVLLLAAAAGCEAEAPAGRTGDRCRLHTDCGSEVCADRRCLGALADEDGDGLSNRVEVSVGSDPRVADSDGDGRSDGDEVGPDPAAPRDADGDGIPDFRERADTDRDSDGTPDDRDPVDDPPPSTPVVPCAAHDECADGGACVGRRCRAGDEDLDGDGLSNAREVALGANPINADSDGDGKADGEEAGPEGSEAPDADGDGRPDVLESATLDSDRDGIPDELDPD